jgi:hypothetical protein
MTEASRGVLDTSVPIDHGLIAAEQLPDESAITAVTLAELAAGGGLARCHLDFPKAGALNVCTPDAHPRAPLRARPSAVATGALQQDQMG